MAVNYIKQSGDGSYELVGTTNVGRPMTIEIDLDKTRKSYVGVEPSPGASMEEPYAEIELQHVMAEQEAIESRVSTIFEMTPASAPDEEILASIASVVSRQKIAPSDIQGLMVVEQRMGM